jgi:hypothetical protein
MILTGAATVIDLARSTQIADSRSQTPTQEHTQIADTHPEHRSQTPTQTLRFPCPGLDGGIDKKIKKYQFARR